MESGISPHSAGLPEQRRLRIIAALESDGAVRAHALASRFDVSVETVRRDLLELEREGLLRRVHGGAVSTVSRAFELPFEERSVANLRQKQAIARCAAGLVRAGETLILDVGTSVTEVAKALPASFGGRVLTNSLTTAGELTGRAGVELIASGGRVRGGDAACSGPTTVEFFGRFYADRAFLGSGGVHAQAGLTDYHLDEIAVREVIISRSRECYVLADSSKIGQIAVGRVCPLDRVTAVITDSAADPDAVAALEEGGAMVLVADLEDPLSPAERHHISRRHPRSMT